ncbi:MAG: hypothetical protein HYS44_01260, partial [Candidatus Niyogibacteria bacterium]|nr:hypothetical protein [Candidatus Niyogibacteria bacterium]
MRMSRWFVLAALAVFSNFIIGGCSASVPKAPESKPISFGYSADYRAKSLEEQFVILAQYFPEFGTPFHFDRPPPLPLGAERYFVIPDWHLLAPTYGEAVEKVFIVLASQRPFYNWREGRLGPEYLRRTEHTAAAWEKLEKEQSGSDVLVVPA